MMTREEFLKELEYADDVLYPGKFSPYARNIATHDQAQRAEIEQRVKQNQALREALQACGSILCQATAYIGYQGVGGPLHEPAAEMILELAQQALKEVS